MKTAEFLPDPVPTNLDAREYYELGLRYRLAGHVERAKEALRRAIELAPASSLSIKAACVLKTQLPRAPVPPEAEQRNIQGYNLMDSNPAAAKSVFEELMVKYPDFEWPFSNTAMLLLQEGNTKKARSLARYLLSVNPDNLRSIHISMQVALAEGDFQEAIRCASLSSELSAGDEQSKTLATLFKLHADGMPPEEIPPDQSADQYYELAGSYLLVGRFEMARQSAQQCIDMDAESTLAVRARSFIKSKLPIVALSPEAETRFAAALKVITTDAPQAKGLLEQLLNEFPSEVVASALASLYKDEGNPAKAERFAHVALARNPDYMNARLFLVNLFMAQGNFDKSLELIKRLSSDDSTDDMSLDLVKAQCELAINEQLRKSGSRL